MLPQEVVPKKKQTASQLRKDQESPLIPLCKIQWTPPGNNTQQTKHKPSFHQYTDWANREQQQETTSTQPKQTQTIFTTATEPIPTLYRDRMKEFFSEDLFGTATRKNFQLKKTIREKERNTWNLINAIFYEIRRDSSINPTDCIIYDNKMAIPIYLEQVDIDTVHHKHTGPAEMLALAQIIWFPNIRSKLLAEAQKCRRCINTGKNLIQWFQKKI